MESRFKERFLSLQKPTVLKDSLLNESWKSIAWNWNTVLEQCGSILMDFRVVPKAKEGPEWEHESEKIEASIGDFFEWISQRVCSESNPFSQYTTDEYWVYSGYNYVDVKFPHNNKFRKGLDWSIFGIDDSCEQNSSFWIGSEGAYTPCHIDTYGFNLVVQIIGKKQWILFPPEDTNFMYPTRIPYEESSIFSAVDILNPDLKRHILFEKSHPHIVTLEPGDVLYVPEKWWHFVHSLEDSVSVNTWIDLESDDENRLKEAIVKTLFAAFSDVCGSSEKNWAVSSKEWTPFTTAVALVEQTLKQITEKKKLSITKEDPEDKPSECTAFKVPKVATETIAQRHSEPSLENLFENIESASPIGFSEFIKSSCNTRKKHQFDDTMKKQQFGDTRKKRKSCDTRKEQTFVSEADNSDMPSLDLKSLVNCFLHPNVISCIAKQVEFLNK